MPVTHRSHLPSTLFATIVTALVLSSQPGQAQGDGAPAAGTHVAPIVHTLPRVVITGRVQAAPRVAELPRVVVVARRTAAPTTLLVQAPARGGERS